jgi:predicted transcriptional regulator
MTTETAAPAITAQQERSAKDDVRALLDRLPDTVTLEDIQYHLDVVVKVLEAEASLERGEGVPHEEVKRQIAQWFAD